MIYNTHSMIQYQLYCNQDTAHAVIPNISFTHTNYLHTNNNVILIFSILGVRSNPLSLPWTLKSNHALLERPH